MSDTLKEIRERRREVRAQEAKPMFHLDHPRPRTRRQFLAQGFLASTATVLAPSLFGLLGRDAYAQAVNCGLVAGGAGRVPFMCFDLAGGASIAGSNVLVGQSGGHQQLLDLGGYSKLGLPANLTPQQSVTPIVDTQLGLPFHTTSAMLAGILDKMSAAAMLNTNGAVICARSSNDTQNNQHNPMYGIVAAGAQGGLAGSVGTRTSESGGNSIAPMSMIDPAFRPTKIDRPSDVTGLVDTGRLVNLMDDDGAASVMNAVERISSRKVDVMEVTENQIVTDLVRCAYEQSRDLVQLYGSPGLLDPLADLDIAAGATPIFDANEVNQRDFERTMSVMKLCVEGHAGCGTVALSGYDYHDGTRATGEGKDFTAGQCIGAALEYAHRKQRDLMVYVFSDGSVASNGQLDGTGKGIWRGDNSSTSSVFMLVYSPLGAPTLVDPTRQQIGYFRPDGSVETNATEVSNSPERLAEAIVLNYLALHGEENLLDQVLPNHAIGAAASPLDLVAFNRIR